MHDLTRFLAELLQQGRVRLPPFHTPPSSALEEAADWLRDFELEYRREMPYDAPSLHREASQWAAVHFYFACQLAIRRELTLDTFATIADPPPPDGGSPSVHYSVDLVFRFLPGLYRLARTAAHRDPLLEVLRYWGRAWPLSSVGMENVELTVGGAIIDCPCLSTLYVDRILDAGDASRLSDPRILQGARNAVGAHPALARGLEDLLIHAADVEGAV
jgi:hypothetical protein